MENIIACIDGSNISNAVCNTAAWASQRLNKPLLLLHTLEKNKQHTLDNLSGAIQPSTQEQLLSELASLDERRSKLALEHGKQLLQQAKQLAIKGGAEQINTIQRHGDILQALFDLEAETFLYILGRSGTDHNTQSKKVVGSHIESALRTLQRPILITTGPFTPPKNFMIAYDGREAADKAIERIINGSLLKQLDCHLIMVANNQSATTAKLNKAKAMLTEHGFNVESRYLNGNIFTELHQYQQKYAIELLVMGAFAHSKVRQFFVGSNTLKMITQSNVTTLIIK